MHSEAKCKNMKIIKTKFIARGLLVLLLITLGYIAFAVPSLKTVDAADNDFSDGITVDSTGDAPDANVGNGVCDDGSGNCTLRAAIEEANSEAGPQTISFNIAPLNGTVKTISPASSLPDIDSEIHIDGFTQDDAVPNTADMPEPMNAEIRVMIDGSSLATSEAGFQYGSTATGSSVKGLSIVNCPGSAIAIYYVSNITVSGVYLGVEPDGITSGTNGADDNSATPVNTGYNVTANNSPGIKVGGSMPEDRFISVASAGRSIQIASGSDNGIVQGGYIGVAADGETAISNAGGGVGIFDSADDFLVGGTIPGARNLVSGNTVSGATGITVDNVSGGVIQNNLVGTDWTGLVALPNSTGINVGTGSTDILVGGGTDAERNVVGASNIVGMHIGGADNVVSGNYVGLGADGVTDLSGGQSGVTFQLGATGNVLGGLTAGERNAITNATNANIALLGIAGGASTVTENQIIGNYIGTDVEGNQQAGSSVGVALVGNVAGNVIGGITPSASNLIYSSTLSIQNVSIAGVLPDSAKNAFLRNQIIGGANNIGIEQCVDTNANFACDANVGHDVNDVGDGDTGPNGLMNHPIIKKIHQVGSQITFTVDLDAADSPVNQYRLEFFSNDTTDSSGYGRGENFIGAQVLSPGEDQEVTFTLSSDTNITAKTFSSTTTAVDAGEIIGFGATSEFGGTSEDVEISYAVAAPGGSGNQGGSSDSNLAKTGQDLIVSIFVAVFMIVTALWVTVKRYRNRYSYRVR
jgi:CSLREA domain-containing protein